MKAHIRVGLTVLCAAAIALALAPLTASAESMVGGVYVTTDPPGAEIYIDNAIRGVSPCAVADVGIGTVEVKAVKEGFAIARMNVTVAADKIAQAALKLEPLPAVGNILVLVEPAGCDVLVDRVPFGKSPCRIMNLREGPHKVEVGMDGYHALYVDITVVTGKDQIVKGTLDQTGERWTPGGKTAMDVDMTPGLDLQNATPTSEQPAAKALDPARKLWDARKYDQAIQQLDRMAADKELKQYAASFARCKRYIEDVRGIVAAGYKALEKKVGQNYSLLLRGSGSSAASGITVEGVIKRVTPDKVEIETSGALREIELERIHIDRIIKLSALEYSPDKPANQALFAVLYAMEQQWTEATDALKRAAAMGYNITEAQNFVQAEKEWAAGLIKDKMLAEEAKKAETLTKKQEELTGGAGGEKPPAELFAVIDRYRGGWVVDQLKGSIEKMGLKVKSVHEDMKPEDFKSAAVIVVKDPGEDEFVPHYDEATVKNIVEFVNGGGGFVFFGTPRIVAGTRATPYDPLLRDQFKIAVLTGRMQIDPKAPRDTPRHHVLGGATSKDPITGGCDKVWFDARAPAVVPGAGASVLMATPAYVSHSATNKAPVALVAIRQVGKGRVVVFSCIPDVWDEESGLRALKLCANAIAWAATPRVQAARGAK
jgi:hypothetical protein